MPAVNLYPQSTKDHDHPAMDGFAITTDDSTDFAILPEAIYVGTGGTVVAVTVSGSVLTFLNVPAGSVLPIRARRINKTNTTAAAMIGLF